MDFKNKRVAIVGGAGGIGAALSLAFASEGAALLVGDVAEEAGRALIAQIVEKGGRADFMVCDLSDDASVAAFADHAFASLGGVDILVNHAGVALGGMLEQVTPADWQWMANLNIVGLGRVMHAFIQRMTDQGAGWIVNTSSGLGLFQDAPVAAPYIASKAAIIAYSRALASYLKNRGIGVSVYCPDMTATGFGKSGRFLGLHPDLVPMLLPSGELQTVESAADCLLHGLRQESFLISAVPNTQARLIAMAEASLAPGSDLSSAGSVPIVQRARMRIPSDKRQEVSALFAEYAAKVREHDGCLTYSGGFDTEDPDYLMVFEGWRDRAAVDAHAIAPESVAFMTRLLELAASDLSMTKIAG
ncbi:SDR family NAD(P)-dependent oxidoreductase [Phyllobacterium sp. K27]